MKKRFYNYIALSFLVCGCAVNPVTGKNELSLVSETQEINIGQQNYLPMRQSQGGDYVVDKELTAYVNQVGQRLAAVSDRKLPYEFNVINNSVPNAWALPGGKIAINRGLLTELESEAELAAVLGHEITHAAAKHSAASMSRGMLLQGAVFATAMATQGQDYAQVAQMGASIGAQLITQRYGRDAERESDYYGMRYMSRAGYDPKGAVELQRTFVKLSEGRNQDWLSGLFSSHPPSQERVQNNLVTLNELPPGGESGSAAFQSRMARLKRTKPAYEHFDEGRKALAGEDLVRARSLAKKAIAVEPKEGHFYALLGDIEKKNKNYKSARQYYNKALGLNDRFFYNYLQRGLVNEELNVLQAAKQDYESSLKLLPTADAYKGLGDIARSEGRYKDAKSFYAKAAGSDSPAGNKAYGSLIDLDLPDNPGKYVKVRTGLNNNGRLIAEISNPTPRDIGGLVLAIEVQDASGSVKRGQQALRGTLRSGTKEVIELGTGKVSKEQMRGISAAIVGAKVVP